MINIILLILILISIYYFFNNNKESIKDNKLNDFLLNNKNKKKYCDITYDNINSYYEKHSENQIIKSDINTNLVEYNTIKSWIPNIYYDSETKQNKEFNNTNNNLINENMIYNNDNAITSPESKILQSAENKTIREIYDKSILDFKKNYKKKKINNNNNIIQCGSNLNILSPNDWNYDNEKSLNGGEIIDGLYGYDPLLNQSSSIC